MNGYMNTYKKYLTDNGVSDNTVISYIHDVDYFLKYCSEHNLETLNEIDGLFITDYINYCKAQKKSEATVNRTVAALKSYFNFLKQRKHCKNNPSQNVKVHAVNQRLPDVLSIREINLLCDFPKSDSPKKYRDSMMIYLAAVTGISVTELCMLDVGDVNLSIGILRVRASEYSRTIPLEKRVQKYLKTYINSKRTSIVSDHENRILFPNLHGGRMSRQGFWKILKSRVGKSKLRKNITPNTLRFSYALRLVEDGADTSYIMDVMGYSDPSALKKYAKIIKERYSAGENGKTERGKVKTEVK
ncbi:MAG: tyrosine-type recombinase/integrase [Acutalibacteraceae bacterium]